MGKGVVVGPVVGPSISVMPREEHLMRRLFLSLAAFAMLAVFMAAPAAGGSGAGELNASFHAGLSGGTAIDAHSDVADGFASPQVNPEGRLEPFGVLEEVCDQLMVGTWVFVLDDDKALLDAWTNEFKLDGEVLDTVRTPLKRVAQGPGKGSWWFAEGAPVLGVLDPGSHVIELTFDDGYGATGTVFTPVEVDAAFCG